MWTGIRVGRGDCSMEGKPRRELLGGMCVCAGTLGGEVRRAEAGTGHVGVD